MAQITGTLNSIFECKKSTIEVGKDSMRIESWALTKSEDSFSAQLKRNPDPEALINNPTGLQSGGLLKIFNSVSDGDVLWDGIVDLDYKTGIPPGSRRQQAVLGYWVHGVQAGMNPDAWGAMFFDSLPARIVKADGAVFFGALEAFHETGTEGVMWSVCDYTKSGYDSLHVLENGDRITVYSAVRDGNVVWQGKLDFQPAQNQEKQIFPALNLPAGIDETEWRRANGHHFPAAYTPPQP